MGFLPLSLRGSGQYAGVNQGGPGYLHSSPEGTPQAGGSEAAQKVEQMRNAERRRHVVQDAAKMLQLTNELKAEIDTAPSDKLSLAALRKAGEIEKLARDMKDSMKY